MPQADFFRQDHQRQSKTATFRIAVLLLFCNSPATVSITAFYDTLSLDFPAQAIADCPYLTVDISAPFLRRCFDNNYYVHYCNDGTVTANDATVEVTLDPYLTYNSSTLPLASQNGNTLTFDIGDVIESLIAKLIRRHPHIYGDVEANNAEKVKQNWEQIKLKEKGEKKNGILDGVPKGLTGIVKAYRMQEKTKQVGFEWDNKDQVWSKVLEEIQEFKEAEAQLNDEEKEKEFGDVLFSLINYARYCNIDPEMALEKTNQKFKKRFQYIEDHSQKPLTEMNLEEMDVLWNEAKKNIGT